MNKHEPTIIEETHEAKRYAAIANEWRRTVAQLTVVELSALTGYGIGAIYRLERGYNANGKPFGKAVWKRYFRVLSAVATARRIKGP